MRKFAIGDIHGRFEALKEVLQKSSFNYEEDLLILLGDISDGGYDTYQVVEELLKIKNVVYCLGNHCEWMLNHIRTGWAEEIWVQQGGANTLRSYGAKVHEANPLDGRSFIETANINIPVTHQEFFNKAKYYHVEDNMLFVHGGYIPGVPMEKQEKMILVWDRDLIERCRNGKIIRDFDKVFIGHTSTQLIMNDKEYYFPVNFGKLWCLDTGAGWSGKLCIMDIHTNEYWLSKKQEPAVRCGF